MEIALEAAEQAGLPKSRVYSFDATGLDKQKGKARLGSQHWTDLLASEADAAKFDWVEPANPKETTVSNSQNYLIFAVATLRARYLLLGRYIA